MNKMHKIVAFYNFKQINKEDIRDILMPYLLNIKGTVLLAEEGINGTVSGPEKDIDVLTEKMKEHFPELSYKFSYVEGKAPFYRLKIKLKKEIVTLRAPEADPTKQVGGYLNYKEWNELILDPSVICIDTRNDYEVKMGTFKGAVNPKTKVFTEFKDYVAKELKGKENEKIAMMCTGGIRCEKASSYMLAHGFKNVYHLKGGILQYLEDTPKEESLWEGECFVFDQRVGVKHGVGKGDYGMCFGCRMPLSELEFQSQYYEEGVSCEHCYHKTSEKKKNNLRQRQKQIDLANSKGQEHIGVSRHCENKN